MADSMLLPSLKPMRTHSRNLSWGGQGTPLSRKLSASPKVASALASTASLHRRTGSLNSDLPVDVVLNFRIARHSSGMPTLDLFHIPENKVQDNLEVLEKMVGMTQDTGDVASAVANLLPEQDVKSAAPGTPTDSPADFVPVVVAHSAHSSFGVEQRGPEGTFDFRLFLTDKGQVASFWHDIPLDNGDGTVNFVCEIPKDTKKKLEVATKEEHTPIKQDIKKGKLREYPYNINWNYGMLPRTWEDPQQRSEELGGIAGDDDPVDVVEIGGEQLVSGQVYKVKVLGAYAMIDEGELDWKIIAIRADDPIAQYLDDIDDVERRMEGVLEKIMVWFRDYKMPDGKPANMFGYDNKPQNKELADRVINDTHSLYQDLIGGTRATTESLALH